jgi:hypothetical protein
LPVSDEVIVVQVDFEPLEILQVDIDPGEFLEMRPWMLGAR